MTFKQLQDAVLDPLNLATPEARKRVKANLNLRYAEVCSGVNLAKTRRTTVSANTAVDTTTVTFTSVANVFGIYDAVILRRPLDEVSVDEIRALYARVTTTGPPDRYAVLAHGASSVTVLVYPRPTAVSALTADVLAVGTTLSADDDEPTFPQDFHDILVKGARYDELLKMEKAQALQKAALGEFEARKAELRYYYAKRAYLSRRPIDNLASLGLSARQWPPYGVAP